MFYITRVRLAHLVAVAIKNMFSATSGITVQEWQDRQDKKGIFFILVFQFNVPIFSVEIDFRKKGQEIKIEWSNGSCSEFIHIHFLHRLFLKISENYA